MRVSVTPQPLFTLGKDPVPIVQDAAWAPGPVWTGAENLARTGIRSPDRTVRSSVAIPTELPGPQCTSDCLKNNIKIYLKIAATCFGAVTPSSGSALSVLAKVTLQ